MTTPALETLKTLPQWVGGKLPDKIPLNPRTGGNAQPDNPATFGTYDQAVAAQKLYGWHCIGFAFLPESAEIMGIDLDKCADENGNIETWAMDIIKQIDSYSEYSPSGRGVHILCYGALPKSIGPHKAPETCEMYDRTRWFTVTGNHVKGTPTTIERRYRQVLDLHAEITRRIEAYNRSQAKPTKAQPRAAATGDRAERYAHAALESELATLAAETEGSRNAQLFKSTAALRELANAGALDWNPAEMALSDTARAIGLEAREVEKTIESAKKHVNGHVRDLPDLTSVSPSTNGARQQAETTEAKPAASLDSTWPYLADRGQTLYQKMNAKGEITETLVADFAAAITAEIVTEDGRRFFGIEGTTRAGGPFSLEISTEDFASDAKLRAALTQATGSQAPIYARQSAHLAPAIQKLTSTQPAQVKRFDRVGWSGGRFIMPGRGDADVRINLPRELPYSVGGDTDQALTALNALLRVMPGDQITVLLAFVFQAPLARLMDWRESDRYALFITGQTGQFKTTVAQAAMAIYGGGFLNDSGLIRWGEGATQNGIMALATRAADAPILIDNFKPSTGGGEPAFYRLLHAILEGGEKTRLTRAAELKESKAIYAWPVFTGEDTPRKDAASLARLLEVKWAGVDTDALTTMQESAAALPAIGAMWLDWLETAEARKIAQRYKGEFSDRRKRWADRIRGSEKDAQNIMRVASNLAGNEITWMVLQSHPALGLYARSHKLPELHRAGLDKIAKAMAEATAKGVEAVRFLEAIQSLVGSGRCVLTSRLQEIGTLTADRHIGWEDGEGVYLVADLAMKEALKLLGQNALGDVSQMKINAQLLELGHIAKTDPSGKIPVTKKCSGKPQRVIHLNKEAIYIPDGDD